jgi:transposase
LRPANARRGECFEKQRQIDRLQEENRRLKAQLRYRRNKEREGFFGSSTPSSQVPVKANTAEREKKKRGAKPGHPGSGRKRFDASGAEEVIELHSPPACPDCGGPLAGKGVRDRMVVESRPLKARRLLYRSPKAYCSRCRRNVQPRAPGILPKSLYGNQLIANAAAMHYLEGVPLGRVCSQIGLEPGPLVSIFHRLASLLAPVPQSLVEDYRRAPVKHADETGWRTNGKNGYVWLFATDRISLFQFQKTRSARVAQAVLGENELPGVLVVDRYAGYNQAPCAIQYCYAHLLRDVQGLEKEFPKCDEVKAFVGTLAPLLSLAMGLRNQRLPTEARIARRSIFDLYRDRFYRVSYRLLADGAEPGWTTFIPVESAHFQTGANIQGKAFPDFVLDRSQGGPTSGLQCRRR